MHEERNTDKTKYTYIKKEIQTTNNELMKERKKANTK